MEDGASRIIKWRWTLSALVELENAQSSFSGLEEGTH